MSKPGHLARAIAKTIMTYGTPNDGTVVGRIALMHKERDGSEKNLGGRDTKSVEQAVQDELEKALCGGSRNTH